MLLDIVSEDTAIVVVDPERVRSRSTSCIGRARSSWPPPGRTQPPGMRRRSILERRPTASWTTSRLARPVTGLVADGAVRVAWRGRRLCRASDFKPAEEYRGDIERAFTAIGGAARDGRRVVVVTAGHGPAERFAEQLRERDMPPRSSPTLTPRSTRAVVTATGVMDHGVVSEGLASRCSPRPTWSASGRPPATCGACPLDAGHRRPVAAHAGDYVVHDQHGVGRFVEMTSRESGRDPRVPRDRVRAGQARPTSRPALRAHRPAGPRHPLRGWRVAVASPAGWRRLGQDEGPGTQGGQPDRRRAGPAVLGASGNARSRLRSGHALAARAGGRIPATSRRPTSWPASTRSSATWSSPCPWTGWCAVTSGTARPRSPCGPRSRRCRTASR